MTRSWLTEASWLVGATLLGLILGAQLGSASAGTLLGLAAWAAWRLRELRRFSGWLDRSLARPPRLSGVLEEFAYRIWRQRRRARARAERLTRMLRNLRRSTQALPDAAVLLEGHDEIRWFNHAARELLGLKPPDLGRNLSGLLRSPDILELIRQPGPATVVETASPIDEAVTLDVRLMDFGEDQRLLLARDITQVARLRTMRQDFIANVSHELRTPLTVMLGYLEALEADTEPEVLARTLEKLRPPAQRMKGLVEDLLLLSRLDTATPHPVDSLPPVDVAAVIRRVCSEARALADGGHTFDVDADPCLRVLGVEAELHSAFANLIMNAVRYSPDGGRIRVRWYARGERARFEVRDEGLGIAPEHVPRLTERFYRVDVGRSRETGGTGLGLAIVKHILRRHDCELEVESEPGVGSTFACEFPVTRVHRHPGADANADAGTPRGS